MEGLRDFHIAVLLNESWQRKDYRTKGAYGFLQQL
jgi:hypothetical protein